MAMSATSCSASARTPPCSSTSMGRRTSTAIRTKTSRESSSSCLAWASATTPSGTSRRRHAHNQFVKRAALHDDEAKTVFGTTGPFDGEHIIDLLLDHPACAPFLVRKLYRFFVREEITPALEAQLAARLREHQYDLAPLLEMIFLSRDFYSAASVATQI